MSLDLGGYLSDTVMMFGAVFVKPPLVRENKGGGASGYLTFHSVKHLKAGYRAYWFEKYWLQLICLQFQEHSIDFFFGGNAGARMHGGVCGWRCNGGERIDSLWAIDRKGRSSAGTWDQPEFP